MHDIGQNSRLSELVGHESGNIANLNLGELRSSDELFFIKTHEVPDDTIASDDTIIYIVRDGRDSCLSYFKYLNDVIGLDAVTVPLVLAGSVPFGLWGRHVLKWHQADVGTIHTFKFEEITVDPSGFADSLAQILKLTPAAQPFPEFDTFQKVSPSFFNSGRVGSYVEAFSPLDVSLFEMYNGIGMQIAGYTDDVVEGKDIAAYEVFCGQLQDMQDQIRTLKDGNTEYRYEIATLRNNVSATKIRIAELEERNSHLSSEYDILSSRYEKFMRFTGLGAVRSLLLKCRK